MRFWLILAFLLWCSTSIADPQNVWIKGSGYTDKQLSGVKMSPAGDAISKLYVDEIHATSLYGTPEEDDILALWPNLDTDSTDDFSGNYGDLIGTPSYVPYTGATGNVNLGTRSLSSGYISSAASGVTQAQFGDYSPLYLLRSYPAFGFNAYYTDAYRYKTAGQYGAVIVFNTNTGTLEIRSTSIAASGADVVATMNSRFAIDKDGIVTCPDLRDASKLTGTVPNARVSGANTLFEVASVNATELVENGTFDSDTVWTKTNATISGGVAVLSPTDVEDGTVTQLEGTLDVGRVYKFTYTVADIYNAYVYADIEGNVSSTHMGTGTYTEYIYTVDPPGSLAIKAAKLVDGSAASVTIDNVSVIEQIAQVRAVSADFMGKVIASEYLNHSKGVLEQDTTATLDAVCGVRTFPNGEINHDTLPPIALVSNPSTAEQYQSIDGMVAAHTAAIKVLRNKANKGRDEITSLRKRVKSLETENAALKQAGAAMNQRIKAIETRLGM
jgi:FtsZ-binding cell division protein ZapB